MNGHIVHLGPYFNFFFTTAALWNSWKCKVLHHMKRNWPKKMRPPQVSLYSSLLCENRRRWNKMNLSIFFGIFITKFSKQPIIQYIPVMDPGFARGGPSSGPPEKCVIWASEYNLGPQIWVQGARAPRAPWIRYWYTASWNDAVTTLKAALS